MCVCVCVCVSGRVSLQVLLSKQLAAGGLLRPCARCGCCGAHCVSLTQYRCAIKPYRSAAAVAVDIPNCGKHNWQPHWPEVSPAGTASCMNTTASLGRSLYDSRCCSPALASIPFVVACALGSAWSSCVLTACSSEAAAAAALCVLRTWCLCHPAVVLPMISSLAGNGVWRLHVLQCVPPWHSPESIQKVNVLGHIMGQGMGFPCGI